MRTLRPALLVLLLSAARGGAETSVSYKFTGGSKHYRGNDASAAYDAKDGPFVEADFSSYRSDISSGVFKTYTGRAGWADDRLMVEGSLGVTPKTDQYRATQGGVDGSWVAHPAGGDGGVKLTLTAGLLVTRHADDMEASVLGGTRRRPTLVQRASTFVVSQHIRPIILRKHKTPGSRPGSACHSSSQVRNPS